MASNAQLLPLGSSGIAKTRSQVVLRPTLGQAGTPCIGRPSVSPEPVEHRTFTGGIVVPRYQIEARRAQPGRHRIAQDALTAKLSPS